MICAELNATQSNMACRKGDHHPGDRSQISDVNLATALLESIR